MYLLNVSDERRRLCSCRNSISRHLRCHHLFPRPSSDSMTTSTVGTKTWRWNSRTPQHRWRQPICWRSSRRIMTTSSLSRQPSRLRLCWSWTTLRRHRDRIFLLTVLSGFVSYAAMLHPDFITALPRVRHAKRSLNAPYKVSTSFCWSPSPFNSRCLYAFTSFPEFSRFVKVDKSTGIKLARIRPLFLTFLLFVPLLVVIWSYPEQSYINSATVHFLWLVRSPGTVCHWTFVCHRHYQRSKTCSRHNSDLISRSYFTD